MTDTFITLGGSAAIAVLVALGVVDGEPVCVCVCVCVEVGDGVDVWLGDGAKSLMGIVCTTGLW